MLSKQNMYILVQWKLVYPVIEQQYSLILKIFYKGFARQTLNFLNYFQKFSSFRLFQVIFRSFHFKFRLFYFQIEVYQYFTIKLYIIFYHWIKMMMVFFEKIWTIYQISIIICFNGLWSGKNIIPSWSLDIRLCACDSN